MSTFNKIINGLILVAAIFCSIFSYYMYQHRIELRERADYLAQTTAQVAKILDGQKQSTSELNIATSLNEDFLGWQSYRHSQNEQGLYTSWENKVDSLKHGAEQIVAMKLEMAEGYRQIAENLKMPTNSGLKLALNSIHTYKAHIDQINSHSEFVYKSNLTLTSSLNKVAYALDHKLAIKESEPLHDPQRTQEKIAELIAVTTTTQRHKKALAQGLNHLAKNTPTEDKEGETLFQPTWVKHDFNSPNQHDLQEAFKAMVTDSHAIHQKLYELKVANKLVEDQRQQISLKENIIEELNSENDELKNNNGRLSAQIKRLEKQVVSTHHKTSRHIQATITEVNNRFKFVVINKGKKDGVIHNQDMIIHNNGKYVCKIRVTKVPADKAICDILPNLAQEIVSVLPSNGSSAVTTN